MNITSKLSNIVVSNYSKMSRFVSANSPIILTIIGVAGTVTTAVLAAKATPKALDLIAEEKKRQLSLKETPNPIQSTWGYVKSVGPAYAPAIVAGSLTIASIVGANQANLRKQAAIATAYTLSEKAFEEYREIVKDKIGDKKEEMVRAEANTNVIASNPPIEGMIVDTKRGSCLCRDAVSGRYFYSDPSYIRQSVNEINEDMINGINTYITLNSFYHELGIPPISIGDNFGWDISNGKLEISYDTEIVPPNIIGVGGRPCLTISYRIQYLKDYYMQY